MKRIISTIMLLWSYYVSADCFDKAGRDYRIDPDLLRAIAWHESKHNTAAIGKNKDGTVDIRIMQINSRNFYHLEKFGITQYHIKNDPCMNIYTGAYYLSSAFKRWGYNWTSVGAYNAGSKKSDTQNKRRLAYAEKIYGIYKNIKLQKAINKNYGFKNPTTKNTN